MSRWTPIAPWRLGAAHTVAIGATHAESPAMGTETRAVLLSGTTDFHVRIGQGAAAASTDTLIKAAYPPIVLGCAPGDVVSVIQDSAAGTAYITELTH